MYRYTKVIRLLFKIFIGVFVFFSHYSLIAQIRTQNVLWYGESTTRGTGVNESRPYNAFMWIVCDRLQRWANHDVVYSFENLGFPGWNSKMANEEKYSRVLNRKYDYIFLEFALNDTELTTQEIEEALTSMIVSIKSKDKEAKIILILLNKVNQIDFRIYNNIIDKTSKVWLDVAKSQNLFIIDIANKMLMKTTDINFYKSIIPDGVHPNEMGHYIYANLIYEDLISHKIFNTDL
ncbi:SGNH/GDSL hydrolase family protein [Confluentibacter lentus]|uniref:SGNH/GDSL hydrolase family protein n=1 Tax=Confluentibacter lentus TaxID=1699412 RepID=UPI000C283801|nr:SGNH/GDSL hydrolase family protein [Confluentibacter lentus]